MLKKSQAALEFLTTYAWAFLVILIMVGALAYFGILNPSKLLPDRCNFGSEIACDKNRMIVNNINDGTLTMRMTNNFGTAVIVNRSNTNITTDILSAGKCPVEIEGNPIPITGGVPDGPGYVWPAGTTITFSADCTGGINLVEKEKIKMNIEIGYYPASAGLNYGKIIFGEIFTTIQ